MDRSLVVWSFPIMESDSGSAYKAASFTSCISHRFRIPIALFHPIHPCPWVKRTGHMERVSVLRKDFFLLPHRNSKRRRRRRKKQLLILFPQASEVWIKSQWRTPDSDCTENTKSWIITWVQTVSSGIQVTSCINLNHAPARVSPVWNHLYIWTSAAGPPTPLPFYDKTQHPHTPKHPLSG